MSELVETIEKMDDLATLLQIKEHMMGDMTVQSCDGRGLHEALGVKTRYRTWALNTIDDLLLRDNIDFLRATISIVGPGGLQEGVNHIFTLDAAKEIALSFNGPRKKDVLRYFLNVEKIAQKAVQQQIFPVLKTQIEIAREDFNKELKHASDTASLLGYSQGEVRREALIIGHKILKNTGLNVLPDYLENDSSAINPTVLVPTLGTHAALVGQGTNCTNVTSIVEMFPKKQITSKEINDILIELGYQVRTVVGQYTLTQKGRKYGNTTLVTKGITQGNQKVTGWDLTFKDFKKELFDSIERRIKYNEARAQMNQYKSKK